MSQMILCHDHQNKPRGSKSCLMCCLLNFKKHVVEFTRRVDIRSGSRVGMCRKCDKDALYNKPGESIRIYCEDHKEKDMEVIFVSGFCIACSRGASYGYDGKRRRCSNHKLEGMIPASNNRYEKDKELKKKKRAMKLAKEAKRQEKIKKEQKGKCIVCKKVTASFGYAKDNKRTHCAEHKLPNMVSLTHYTKII